MKNINWFFVIEKLLEAIIVIMGFTLLAAILVPIMFWWLQWAG
jgi:hypothetical protein